MGGQTVPTLPVDPMLSSKRETGVRVDPLARAEPAGEPALRLWQEAEALLPVGQTAPAPTVRP